MACWFKAASQTSTKTLIGFGNSSSYPQLYLGAQANTNYVFSLVEDTGTSYSITTVGYDVGEWNHACGVFTSNTLRASYLNGGNKATNATSRVFPSTANVTTIGVRHRGGAFANYMDGVIAEAGIWNVALTDAEVASLAAGFSPLFVRPASLVAYWPLIRDEDIDIVGGYDLTAYNSPTIAAHCPIMRPAAPQVITKLGAGAGSNIPVIMQHYKKMRVA